jgi:hypothetical protein
VTDEHDVRVEAFQPTRREEPQQRLQSDPFLAEREEPAHRAERLGDDEQMAVRPPQRALAPARNIDDLRQLERRVDTFRQAVMRHSEAPSQLGAVAVVPVEQLDHAGRFAERACALLGLRPRERIDEPEAAFGGERVRRPLEPLLCDPAEAVLADVAEPKRHRS